MNPEDKVECEAWSVWLSYLLSRQIILQYRGACPGIARGCRQPGDAVGKVTWTPGQALLLTCWVVSAGSETSVNLTDFTVECGRGPRGSLVSLLTLEFDRFSLYPLPWGSLSFVSAFQPKQMAHPNSLLALRCFLSVNSFFSDQIISVPGARHSLCFAVSCVH